jgi:hypothetical protein
VDDSAASLPDEQLTYSKRQLLYYLKRGVRRPEQIEVLALAHSRANGVLALTNYRLGFAWELGFSPTRRFLDRASIMSAELEGADLVVRDASEVWRYQNVSPPGRAAEIAERLSHVAPFPCFDDPNQDNPTLNGPVSVGGNITETQPVGVIVHDATIQGNVTQNGAGGGFTCDPTGVFALLGPPVYSAYEDSSIAGNVGLNGITSCLLGMARDQVGGDVRVSTTSSRIRTQSRSCSTTSTATLSARTTAWCGTAATSPTICSRVCHSRIRWTATGSASAYSPARRRKAVRSAPARSEIQRTKQRLSEARFGWASHGDGQRSCPTSSSMSAAAVSSASAISLRPV